MRGYTGLSQQTLNRLYVELGKTDKEIADFFNVDRTTIAKQRQSFSIPSRITVGEIGEQKVVKKLRELGHRVIDMNKADKTSPFDLLVDNNIRIDVKASSISHTDRFYFTLTDRPEKGCVESETRIRLPNGRTRKVYRNTCDFIIAVGMSKRNDYMFIIPSSHLPNDMQTFSIPKRYRGNKYEKYFEAWNLMRRAKGAATPIGSI
jgi:hypothetical protein